VRAQAAQGGGGQRGRPCACAEERRGGGVGDGSPRFRRWGGRGRRGEHRLICRHVRHGVRPRRERGGAAPVRGSRAGDGS